MPFIPKTAVPKTPTVGVPTLDASQKLRMESEFRTLRLHMNQMAEAIEEIQSYLKTV